MRILFLTENFPPETNASATRVYERALYWVRGGHQVTIVTTAPNFPQGRVHSGYRNSWHQVEFVDGLRVVRVKTFISRNEGFLLRTLDFLSFMVTGFLGGLAQRRPDVVVATSPQFFTAVAGWAVAHLRRVPFVFELSDLWPATIRAVGAVRAGFILNQIEKVELFLYRQSAAVVALTESFKADLVRRQISREKVHVVLNGVDLGRYGKIPPDEELLNEWKVKDRFVVGYIGTHGMCQALGNVLDAALLMKDSPDVVFLLVGAGAEREMLMKRARDLKLSNVMFAPAQPKKRMPAVWSICDVALIHLKNDPLFQTVIPSKIFEAMGMELPLILSGPDGEAHSIIKTTGAGLYAGGEDPVRLKKAILTLKNDVELRREVSRASRQAAPMYTRRRQAESMFKVFERITSSESPPPRRVSAGCDSVVTED